MQHYVGALAVQSPNDRGADALRPAGNEHNFP
jgi:hypothetical protein